MIYSTEFCHSQKVALADRPGGLDPTHDMNSSKGQRVLNKQSLSVLLIVQKLILLHSKWSHLDHLLKVKEPVPLAELHRSVRWHKQQRRVSGVAQTGLSAGAARHEALRLFTFIYTHTHTLSAASGVDQLVHTKTLKRQKNAGMWFVLCVHMISLTQSAVVFTLGPAYRSTSSEWRFFVLIFAPAPNPLQLSSPGPLTYIHLLITSWDQSHLAPC